MQKHKPLAKQKKGGVVVSYATSTTSTTPPVIFEYPKKVRYGKDR